MRTRFFVAFAVLAAVAFAGTDGAGRRVAEGQATKPAALKLESLAGLQAINVKMESVAYKGRKAVRVVEAPQPEQRDTDALVLLTGTEFHDGVIEAAISGAVATGAPEGSRGFVGMAFRVQSDPRKLECFYLRPTNGRAEDQVRRNHSLQYISHPEFPWQRLRKEFPEKYESYVDLIPGEWTKMRIEVRGGAARLYIHDNKQPNMIVNDLKHGDTSGAVALWIGQGTEAHFAGVKITP